PCRYTALCEVAREARCAAQSPRSFAWKRLPGSHYCAALPVRRKEGSLVRYLAIDLGAESGRGVVGTLSDGRLELHEVHRFPNLPVRLLDGLHWDVLGLYTQIKQAIGLAARESPEPLRGIGIDSWGVDYGL